MKKINIILIINMLVCFVHISDAQIFNWKTLEDSKHIVHAGVGWDYSLSYQVGYSFKLNSQKPLLLTSSFLVPSGENTLDDFKTKMGVQMVVFNGQTLKGSITANGIFRRYENPLVNIQNFGSELKGNFGLYKNRWFVAGEIGFDKAIVTKFSHSDSYKSVINTNVQNGWFEPATGGNFMYGFQTGVSFKKSDILLNVGKVLTQDFKTTPLIPYYLHLGYNLKIR